ncbi:MFS transporter [Clostridium gasigenes]|uniref:MFS transporter n=1 Tax=Clostridium gasigenes TaxID=94869 RepID=UPI0014382A0E|nr:MFS transporter [Clostridium gasigenes]NKF08843.1 MFS transporter [Clostridium gasigenes]QSW19531.1 MFS transporter [Clostridium gasigenes]
MGTFFLIIIYITFISLGLPDSLLGSAWPIMHRDLGVELSSAGIVSMIITSGTIVSSILSSKVIRRFGTGKVTFVSVTMTAGALFGFSLSQSFIWLCILAIPLGLGAGAVDSSLNNFVALHYKAKHMSWLHCFWGVGATSSPIIMSFFIANNNDWQKGYFSISIIQFLVVLLLIFTLPMWKKMENNNIAESAEDTKKSENVNIFKLPGAKLVLVSFLCYCATESTVGLWGSSYLVNHKGISPDVAARWLALFFGGITVGRLISGFVAMKLKSNILIRIGQSICIIGVTMLMLPLATYFSMVGLILIGLGCAPIFPSMLHDTPNRFGKDISQSIMGVQMAFAYIGSTIMPPLLGFIALKSGIGVLPIFLLVFIVIMLICSEKINIIMKAKKVV